MMCPGAGVWMIFKLIWKKQARMPHMRLPAECVGKSPGHLLETQASHCPMVCRHCDYPFSRTLDVCPKCGCRNPGTIAERVFKLGAILLGLAALVFIVYASMSHLKP